MGFAMAAGIFLGGATSANSSLDSRHAVEKITHKTTKAVCMRVLEK
jgi:hypothetical protein